MTKKEKKKNGDKVRNAINKFEAVVKQIERNRGHCNKWKTEYWKRPKTKIAGCIMEFTK